MNKQYGIIIVFVLLMGAVFLSACQSDVGGRVNRNVANGNENNQQNFVSRQEMVNYVRSYIERIPSSGGIILAERNQDCNNRCREYGRDENINFQCLFAISENPEDPYSGLMSCDDDSSNTKYCRCLLIS